MAARRQTTRIKKGQRKSPVKDWKPAFLEAIKVSGNVTAAAHAAGINRTTPYLARHQDPDFARDWALAEQESVDLLVAEARRRAYSGVTQDIYHNGKVVGQKLVYSDTLLIFLLKKLHPTVFGDHVKVEHSAPDIPPPKRDVTYEIVESWRDPDGVYHEMARSRLTEDGEVIDLDPNGVHVKALANQDQDGGQDPE